MLDSVPDILARIVAHKREELAAAPLPREELERLAEVQARSRRDFKAALKREGPAILAEIKRASPSKGVLAADLDPARTARAYAAGGAAALSVLTDRAFFQGSLEDLRAAREAVAIPVLRKDFTIDEYHVVEAAAHGADAILLIAAVLDAERLRAFRELAAQFGMAALVEVHDRRELDAAVESGAEIIGVNSRNLHNFEVRLETAIDLAPLLPADAIRVAESGIHSAGDVRRLRQAGYDAFLVGESLMRSADPEAALRALLS
jgi:indole-3-glycerol phosphate synthase